MSWNVNVPPLKVWVRNEFLYNQSSGHGDYTQGWVHAVRSIKGNALQFYVLLESGALFTGLPIHAFTTDKTAPKWELSKHQLWDNLSSDINCFCMEFIKGMNVDVFLKDKTIESGWYLFSLDYAHVSENSKGLANTPDEWKSAHVIELKNGNIVAYPPNRIAFKDASLTDTSISPASLGYKVNTTEWHCETGNKCDSYYNNEEYYYKNEDEKK